MLQSRRKKNNSGDQESPFMKKTLAFVEKPCFLLLKKKALTSNQNKVENTADGGIRARYVCPPNRSDAHIYVLFKALTALQYERA